MTPTKKFVKFVKKSLKISPAVLSLDRSRSYSSFTRHTSLADELASLESPQPSFQTVRWESDLECTYPPTDVPKGCLAVYVGRERRRFVIRAGYLNHNVFRVLLAKSEEEFGFDNQGGLRIACEPDLFERLMWRFEGGHSHHLQVEDWWVYLID